ncbi:sulfite exporter TauE/SafE family protein [Haloechinothrix salitolerans]|uniref:Probable membrane transporter protein n=1 Tax=Haloechinothrix salitolerans TaxID=926830 RepID=A0ABW2C1W9_9PSEU
MQQWAAEGWLTSYQSEIQIVIAAFLVGIVVGITGMGGGALMTPALLFLGAGNPSAVITADLTAAAVYKSGGALVHWRHGSPNLKLALWLVIGSVPTALLGPPLLRWLAPPGDLETILTMAIGFALLFATATFALRLYIQLRRVRRGQHRVGEPVIKPVPTMLVGALGGLLVGITSVGAGSVIMIALITLYPTLSAVKLVGSDLVQAVPLVLAAAIANILTHGLDLALTIPLIIGSVPGTLLGARIAPKVPASLIRRSLVIVLTMSGFALLDEAGWGPLSAHDTNPFLILWIGIGMLVALPLVWGLLRKREGLPMFGKPTVDEIESAAIPETPDPADDSPELTGTTSTGPESR